MQSARNATTHNSSKNKCKKLGTPQQYEEYVETSSNSSADLRIRAKNWERHNSYEIKYCRINLKNHVGKDFVINIVTITRKMNL